MSARPSPVPRPAPRPHPPALPVAPRPLPYQRTWAADPEVHAPGIAALLRRHPTAVRRGAIGAIASGTVLFVVASLLTPGAGAEPARHRAPRGPVVAQPGHVPLAGIDAISMLHPGVRTGHDPVTTSARRHKVGKRTPSVSGLAANGIPNVALNAYRVAAARMASADPGCGIDWALLAGIGRVESDHGRFGGAVLHSDGTSTPRIVGPALNGHGTALIAAPANGAALDGDPVYTHALGPMQFIPQTWAGYGVDADNDGRADIFDIDDAALGAARYLCAAGGNLRTQDGRVRAVMAYNHVTSYVAEVLALADAYRRGVPISGIPVGQLTGSLPPVKRTGTAANPGAPTAIGDKTGKTAKRTKAGHSSGDSPPGGGSSPSPTSSRTSTGSRPSSSTSTSRPSTSSPTSTAPSSSPSSAPPSSSSSPSPSPSPSKTCKIVLGHTCVIH